MRERGVRPHAWARGLTHADADGLASNPVCELIPLPNRMRLFSSGCVRLVRCWLPRRRPRYEADARLATGQGPGGQWRDAHQGIGGSRPVSRQAKIGAKPDIDSDYLASTSHLSTTTSTTLRPTTVRAARAGSREISPPGRARARKSTSASSTSRLCSQPCTRSLSPGASPGGRSQPRGKTTVT